MRSIILLAAVAATAPGVFAQPLPARKQSLPARESALARLSTAQAQAAMALARGATVTAAADALGVHRSTIYHWFKTDPAFKIAVEETWRERIERTNDEMREIEALALINLRAILQDPTAPAGVRLRAASPTWPRRSSTQLDTSFRCRGRPANCTLASNAHESVALDPRPDTLRQLFDVLGLLDRAEREDERLVLLQLRLQILG